MAPPKTAAELQRKQMEKLKAEGKYDEQKKERALKHKINKQNQKQKMGTEEKAKHKLKRKMEHQKHRQNKSQLLISPPQATRSLAYKSRSTEAKKVEHNFPKSPRKMRAVFKNLAIKLSPGETIFKKVCKNPSVLTDAVKATALDFYCSDII